MHTAAETTLEEPSTNTPLNREDPSLVASARAGDCEAFDVLAATYRKGILNIARRITRNREDAEDVTQRTLMKAFLNVRGFKGTCAFMTWLKSIAINEALMLRRHIKSRPEVGWPQSSEAGDLGISSEFADVRPNPEQCFETHEWRRLLLSEMKKLTPNARSAMQTRYLNEYSMKDLAMALGISVSAAKARLFRSRSILRTKLIRSLNTRATERDRPPSLPA